MSDARPQPKPATASPAMPEASKSEASMPESSMPESSMEEIIASIGRIIAEDNRSSEPGRPAPGEKRGILELTDAIEPDGSIRRLGAAAASPAGAGPAVPPAVAARVEPERPLPDPRKAADPAPPRDPILSAAAAAAAATAFAQLGPAPRERPAEGEVLAGARERALEEIVRDTLRPLLQAWLDDHLPGLVERLVRDEIARVAGRAGLR